MTSLIPLAKCRVSSVLDRNSAEFGKDHMFDNNPETCWSSAQGSSQFVILSFSQSVVPSDIVFHFQGGFAPTRIDVMVSEDGKTFSESGQLFPKNMNGDQTFAFPSSTDASSSSPSTTTTTTTRKCVHLQLLFPGSTDFYGRITVYKLDILGTVK
eukprot:ANDGO_04876.mRNA.1 hypothetical protein DICPUDRAFT_31641